MVIPYPTRIRESLSGYIVPVSVPIKKLPIYIYISEKLSRFHTRIWYPFRFHLYWTKFVEYFWNFTEWLRRSTNTFGNFDIKLSTHLRTPTYPLDYGLSGTGRTVHVDRCSHVLMHLSLSRVYVASSADIDASFPQQSPKFSGRLDEHSKLFAWTSIIPCGIFCTLVEKRC